MFANCMMMAAAKTYATWNPSDKTATAILSNGNLTCMLVGTGGVRATIGKSAGKWYWEIKADVLTHSYNADIGFATLAYNLASDSVGTTSASGMYWDIDGYAGNHLYNGSGAFVPDPPGTSPGVPGVVNDIVGIALNMDSKFVTIYINGTIMVIINISATSGAVYPLQAGTVSGSPWLIHTANFGASAFVHTVPSGYNRGLF